jgi:hypothetical protein
MLGRIEKGLYSYGTGDSYHLEARVTGAARVQVATICGHELKLPAAVTPRTYELCPPNYEVNIVFSFVESTGVITVVLTSGGAVIDEFDIPAPPDTPVTRDTTLIFRRNP